MTFTILSNVPEEMYEGLIIRYKIKIPILGEQNWVSEMAYCRQTVLCR